jgi:hypothetical protein
MAQSKSIRLPGWLQAAVGTLLGLLLLQVLFDPIPYLEDAISVLHIRRELPRALERWKSRGVTDYRIDVRGAIPLACILDGELTVRNGLLVGVRMRANPLVPDSPLVEIDSAEWEDPFCPYNDLTVEGMFARLRRGVDGVGLFGAPLRVTFDEESGYIAEYRFGRSSRGGVFGYSVSECCTWFEFDNLQALEP